MAQMVAKREISPVELVKLHLQQISAVNPQINAFVRVLDSEALESAQQAEAALTKGEPLGPLHGVPVSVKDSFDMAGLPTLCGSKFRLGHVARQDATAVKRLRDAGAIILGKTNTPEFLNNYETDNYITGRTNNPWNLSYTAGGSSGGESAAIAAFCSAGGIGSDGGGSIRIPAHFTGICGLKPTPGRVSAAGHFPEIAHPGGLLGVAGPMARTAEDVRLLFSVLAGDDWQDPFSAPVPLRIPDLNGIQVGFWPSMFGTPYQGVTPSGMKKVFPLLETLGLPVELFEPIGFEQVPDLWFFFFERVFAPLTQQVFAGRESDAHWTGTELLERALQMPVPSATDVIRNMIERDALRIKLFRQMENFPVLLTPVCSSAAFPHRKRPFDLLEMMKPVTVFNLFGMPALVIPFDMSPEGMPVGIQLAARPWQEELLLEIAVRLEKARGPFPQLDIG